MPEIMCDVCHVVPATARLDLLDRGNCRTWEVCATHAAELLAKAKASDASALEARLDEELKETFPASDALSVTRDGANHS